MFTVDVWPWLTLYLGTHLGTPLYERGQVRHERALVSEGKAHRPGGESQRGS